MSCVACVVLVLVKIDVCIILVHVSKVCMFYVVHVLVRVGACVCVYTHVCVHVKAEEEVFP